MDFEYDSQKSEANRRKHGLTLEEATILWLEPGVEIRARTVDETRFCRIGKIQDKLYSCFFTIRNQKIRLISARRSRPKEDKIYEEKIHEEKKENGNEGP